MASTNEENDFGTIKGKITTNDNRPASAVTITIRGAKEPHLAMKMAHLPSHTFRQVLSWKYP
ncbi:hypothetical protein [Chitinophaga pinensis]|uniref:hypothetical protein n=1 Tax=Chitinophaga pinensis TaxID=79329 RepID=UPI0021BCFBB4|nr:hypothetical protein [Chitinophaga pinensis]